MVVFRYQMLCQLKNNDILSFILVQMNKEKQRFVDIIFHRKDAEYAKKIYQCNNVKMYQRPYLCGFCVKIFACFASLR